MKQACLSNILNKEKDHEKKKRKRLNLANSSGCRCCSTLQAYTNQTCQHSVQSGPQNGLDVVALTGTAAGCTCPRGRTLVRCSAVGSPVGPWRCLGSAAAPMLVGLSTTSERHSRLSPEPRWQGRAPHLLRRPPAWRRSRSCRSTCSPDLFDRSVQLQSAGEGKRL